MPDLDTSLELCTFCPRLCSHTCPTSLTSGRETVTPQAKMARYGVLKEGPFRQAGASAVADAEPLWACTGCGACTTACLHEVEPATALMRGRADAQRADIGPPELLDLPARHRRRAQAAAASLASDAEVALRFAVPGEIALLPACLPRGAAQDGPVREARSMLRVLDRLRAVQPDLPKVGVASLPTPGNCAGYPLYAGGFAESFRFYAESFARSVEPYATLAVSCSACAWLLRTQYPEHGVPLRPQVVHTSELLAPYAEALPINPARRLPTATYHDPCHLGRRLGCYEPPRQLLRRAVVDLVELPTSHGAPEARCCGAGGLLPITAPTLARDIAIERLADVDAKKAPLITACPACAHHLDKSGDTEARDLFAILDAATAP